MKIRDVYEKDPTQNRLLNQGRAILAIGHSEPELRTLRFELTNFVCDGQYQEGLNRILSTYLTNLDQTEQPGVWVSGFYGSGKKGSEIRQHFADPPCGWPRDAVDAALFVLCNGGLLQAKSGSAALSKGKLDQKSITTTEFRVETITLSKVELIAIRGLCKDVGLTVQPGQESTSVPEFLSRMRRRAEASGGASPLPARPSTTHLDDVANRVGNDQPKTIYNQISALKKQASEWRKQGELIAKREPRWCDLKGLFAHANGLPVANQVRDKIVAIESSRGLLADPDPGPGLIDQLTQALRDALNKAHSQCIQLQAVGRETLDASPT